MKRDWPLLGNSTLHPRPLGYEIYLSQAEWKLTKARLYLSPDNWSHCERHFSGAIAWQDRIVGIQCHEINIYQQIKLRPSLSIQNIDSKDD